MTGGRRPTPSLALCLALGVSGAAAGQPTPTPPPDATLDSIATFERESAGDSARCVAFLVADDLLLTARHCVAPYRRDGVRPLGSRYALHFAATDRYGAHHVEAHVVAESTAMPETVQSAIDWALLRTDAHVPRPALRLARSPTEAGTSLRLVRPPRPSLACTTALGSLVAPHVDDGRAPVLVLAGCPFEPGDSGSPLLDARGEVVGIATARDVRPWPTDAPLTFPASLRGAPQRPRRSIGYGTRVACVEPLARAVDPACDAAAWAARARAPGAAADARAAALRRALDEATETARRAAEAVAERRPAVEAARVMVVPLPDAPGARVLVARRCAATPGHDVVTRVEVSVDEDAVPRVETRSETAESPPTCAGALPSHAQAATMRAP